jgi:hypothetical protein
MKKVLVALVAAAMAFGGAGMASAKSTNAGGNPGPNGNNNHGLCTAYFNGQKNGHTEGEGPGPFGALEDGAEDSGENEDLVEEQQVSDDVFEYCDQFGIGGNPEQNGRFDCREGEDRDSPARDEDTDSEIECVANGTETPPAA